MNDELKKDRFNKSDHPWAQLMDVDSGIRKIKDEQERGVGRPSARVDRVTRTYNLAEDEVMMLEEIAHKLKQRTRSKIYLNQVLGFSIRLMHKAIMSLSDDRSELSWKKNPSWENIANTIFGVFDKNKK